MVWLPPGGGGSEGEAHSVLADAVVRGGVDDGDC
jgi:hypothetical protein